MKFNHLDNANMHSFPCCARKMVFRKRLGTVNIFTESGILQEIRSQLMPNEAGKRRISSGQTLAGTRDLRSFCQHQPRCCCRIFNHFAASGETRSSTAISAGPKKRSGKNIFCETKPNYFFFTSVVLLVTIASARPKRSPLESTIMPFDGLRVLALESRRSEEIATLIRKQGGEPFVATSMREVPLARHGAAFNFADRLLRREFDCLILLTGVGTRLLWQTLLTRYPEADLKSTFAAITLVARGPKPSAALREIGLEATVPVPEPNTWRDVIEAMRNRPETRIALQEYGRSNADLIDGLTALGKDVTPVPIYAWDLPEDTRPLRQAAARLIAGQFDAVLLTTSTQIVNLMRIAEEEGISQQVIEALQSAFIGSIGPTTSETLEEYGIKPDFEPSHPRMGLLVNEAAQVAAKTLEAKR
jgi:uroporphyrinogen-III synthase